MAEPKGMGWSVRRVVRVTDFTETYCSGEKGTGGMYHRYHVDGRANTAILPASVIRSAEVQFQQGPVAAGINGCQDEDLLAIVIDRLACAQAGPSPCDENKQALHSLKLALSQLEGRSRKALAPAEEVPDEH